MFNFMFTRSAAVPAAETDSLVPLHSIVGILARREAEPDSFRMSVRALSEAQCEAHTFEPLTPGERLRLKVVTGSQALDLDALVLNVTPAEIGHAAWMSHLHFVRPTAYQRQLLRTLVTRYGRLTA